MMKTLTAMLAALLFLNTGCSWIGVQRVYDGWEPSEPLKCTSGRAAPVLDSVGASILILSGIISLTMAAGDSCQTVIEDMAGFGPVQKCIDKGRAIGIGAGALALGAALFVSAGQGFVWTEECRDKTEVRTHWANNTGRQTDWVITKVRIAEKGVDQLGLAVSLFEADTIRSLIDRGADVNQQDTSGRTPLHWAVDEGKLDIVELLASKGADINARDGHDFTPLQLALERIPDRADRVHEILARYGKPE